MPKYVKGEENKYFPGIVAALVILASAIGFFIYSLVTGPADKNLEKVLVEDEGVVKLNPGSGLAVPTSEPNIEQPTTPPPGK